jgi:aryl-alcohol dehydrogenase-like predicted oxidoreductase
LTALADEIGATTAQLAIAWLLRIPEVSSVITGASRLEHLDDNLKALEFVEKLTPDILDKIEVILDNYPGETEEA